MSEKYKVRDQSKLYFVTFTVAYWIDAFSRKEYKDILLNSLRHCQKLKGLCIYAWCIMTNHVHLIVGKEGEDDIEDIIRDMKKFTSVHICKAIESNSTESRRGCWNYLREPHQKVANMENICSGRTITIRLNLVRTPLARKLLPCSVKNKLSFYN